MLIWKCLLIRLLFSYFWCEPVFLPNSLPSSGCSNMSQEGRDEVGEEAVVDISSSAGALRRSRSLGDGWSPQMHINLLLTEPPNRAPA
jgi:hypothetical protein